MQPSSVCDCESCCMKFLINSCCMNMWLWICMNLCNPRGKWKKERERKEGWEWGGQTLEREITFVHGIPPCTNAPTHLYQTVCTDSIPSTNEGYEPVQKAVFPVVTVSVRQAGFSSVDCLMYMSLQGRATQRFWTVYIYSPESWRTLLDLFYCPETILDFHALAAGIWSNKKHVCSVLINFR
jgi:hypothetical protein